MRYTEHDRNTYRIIVGATRLDIDLTTGAKKKIGPVDILDFPAPPATIPLANSDAGSDPCVDRSERQPGEEVHMRTFSIDRKNNITVIENAEAVRPGKEVRFHSGKEWEDLVQSWPLIRLVNAWNGITGTVPVSKFPNRKMATARIWKAIQNLEPVAGKLPAKREKARPPVKATAPVEPAKGSSKKDEVIALLSSRRGYPTSTHGRYRVAETQCPRLSQRNTDQEDGPEAFLLKERSRRTAVWGCPLR